MAAGDLRAKRRLERRLSASLRGLFAAVARGVEEAMRGTGGIVVPPIVTRWHPVLRQSLVEHYARTTRAFAWRLSAAMPADIRPSERERQRVAREMALVFHARADGQARVILETAERRVARAIGRAHAAVAAPGSGLTGADVPRIAARHWLARQVVHGRAVAAFETQTAAETAKGIEAAMLLGGASPVHKAAAEATKVWATQGDSRVRGSDGRGDFDHFEADGQRVPVSGAFEVSGERLRWPGDWSLGASGGNVYGCRCSAVYEADSLAELRALVVDRIRSDVERFTQTESDVVVSLPFML